MNSQEVTQQPAAIISSQPHYVTVDWSDMTKSPERMHTFDCRAFAFEMAREIKKAEPEARVMVWTLHGGGDLISFPTGQWMTA